MKKENIQPAASAAEQPLLTLSGSNSEPPIVNNPTTLEAEEEEDPLPEPNGEPQPEPNGEQQPEPNDESLPEPSEKTLERAQLAASATPDGALTVTMIGMEGFMRIEEAEAKAYQEYLRGRNEAIEAQFGDPKKSASTASRNSASNASRNSASNASRNSASAAAEDSAAAAFAEDFDSDSDSLDSIFNFRDSIWDEI